MPCTFIYLSRVTGLGDMLSASLTYLVILRELADYASALSSPICDPAFLFDRASPYSGGRIFVIELNNPIGLAEIDPLKPSYMERDLLIRDTESYCVG